MRICLCIDRLDSGGAERVISTLANEFSNMNNEVFFIETSNFNSIPFYELSPKIHHINLLKTSKSSFAKKIPLLKKCLKEIKPDFVISFKYQTNILCYFATLGTKIKHIVSERNDPNNYSIGIVSKLLRKRVFRNADGCVFQTEDALKFYFRHPNKKTTIISNPLFLLTNPILPSAPRNNTILSVGRLENQKNTLMLINAFNDLNVEYPSLQLKIYGSGSLKQELIKYAESLKSGDNISFLGNSKTWQEDEKNSAMFVLSSNFEGIPNSLMEAMSLGIPCISTDCPIGGPSKLIRNGINGLLIEVGNTDQLKNTMKTLIDNPSLGISFANENKNMIKDYSSSKIAQDWMTFMERISV